MDSRRSSRHASFAFNLWRILALIVVVGTGIILVSLASGSRTGTTQVLLAKPSQSSPSESGILPIFFDFKCIGGSCGPFDEVKGRAGGPITWTLPRAADFTTDHYKDVVKVLENGNVNLHRKQWEFYEIYDILVNKLKVVGPGRSGVGFGVGLEPLASSFAALGAQVLGTELPPDNPNAQGWNETMQHAGGKDALFRGEIISRQEFDKLVNFRYVNMNEIPSDWQGKYDFVWSAGTMEHVGSLDLSKAFFLKSAKLLKPGGVSIHTTELLMSSFAETLISPAISIWRIQDLVEVRNQLESDGFEVWPIDLRVPRTELDMFVDREPYRIKHHYKLWIGNYASTSVSLVVRRKLRT